MKLSCVLLIGSESPYGFPHLEPFLSDPRFNVRAVVLPTPARCAIFRNALEGSPYRPPSSLSGKLRRIAANPRLIVDRFRERSEESPTDRARKMCAGVPVIDCDDANAEDFLGRVEKLNADFMFSAAYPQIFKPVFLRRAARKLCANSHPSLLPKYRGAHPVFWAVRNGETQTGVTFHVLTEALDEGPIIAQLPVPIERDDDRAAVSRKIGATIPDLVSQLAENLLTPDFSPIQQAGEPSIYRQDREIHHLIQWTECAESIRNLVRACNGEAFCFAGDARVTIGRCEAHSSNRNLTNAVRVAPGTIVDVDADGFCVASGSGVTRVTGWSGFTPRIGRRLA